MSHEYDPQAHAEAIIEDQIRTEILSGVEQAGSVVGYIANFTENLPGGLWRSQVESGGWMDRTLADPEYEQGSDEDPHSARAHEVTYAQFFADVDQAVAASGVDVAELEHLRAFAKQPTLEQLVAHEDYSSSEAQEAYSRFALPIYLQLRILGYSLFELRR